MTGDERATKPTNRPRRATALRRQREHSRRVAQRPPRSPNGRHGAAVVAAGADAAPLLLRRSERLEEPSRRARSERPPRAWIDSRADTCFALPEQASHGGRSSAPGVRPERSSRWCGPRRLLLAQERQRFPGAAVTRAV